MRRTLPVHPFFFALFPVSFLYAQNIRQFSPTVAVVPAVVLVVAAGVLLVLMGAVLRSAKKAALVVSLFLVLFFSFTHACRVLPEFRPRVWGVLVTPTKVVFLAWVLAFVGGTWLLVRTKRRLDSLTRILNVTAAVLVAISLVNIGLYELGARQRPADTQLPRPDAPPATQDVSQFPDMYYIILDAYARQDVLREVYDYDNTAFLDGLRRRGFTVAEKSTSNYAWTVLSLASSLNMRHIADLLGDIDPESGDLLPLSRLIRHSEVRRLLKQRGYTVYAFSIGYKAAEMTTADVFLSPGWFSGEFPNALIDMTPLWALFQRLALVPQHRSRIRYAFEQLERLPERPSPKFVFCHVMSPHYPFVFGPAGEPVNPRNMNARRGPRLTGTGRADYRKYYAGQLAYTNTRITKAIDAILEKSRRPPVIILQGDHGPESLLHPKALTAEAIRERHAILNAYYLRGEKDDALYAEITPVNSFRIVFNHCFGTDYELLEDENFFSMLARPYQLEEVTGQFRSHPGR